MQGRININVSAVNYEKTSRAIISVLGRLEEMTHCQGGFAVTDSEFALGWHFFVVSVDRGMVQKLTEQAGPEFEALKGKGTNKKFLAWLTRGAEAGSPRFKLAIKEEMESSKFGLF